MAKLTHLFKPIKVGSLELKNRIKMPALAMAPQVPEGEVLDRLQAFYIERARGGAAILGVSCTPTRLVQSPMLGLYDDGFIAGLKRLTGAVHAHDAKIYAQVGVGYSWAFGDAPVELVSPSGISLTGRPGTPFRLGGPLEPQMPRALTVDELHSMVDAYGESARRAREAGFDAVEVIASVGYILAQFLSPLTNRRDDAYGGNFENRMRLLLEIVDSMRAKAGSDYTYTCRLSGSDLLAGGYTIEDTARMARMLEDAGIHEIDVMSGWHNAPVPIIQSSVPQGAWADMAHDVKRAVGIPVAAGTQIQDVVVAEQVLAGGKADLIYMARSLIADPELPNKARDGRLAEIRPCMNCCRCIESPDNPPVYCSVNARMGREHEYPADAPIAEPRRVLIAGGGPAGMESARVAALRGHEVVLCERSSRLGGALLAASMLNNRIGRVIKHLEKQLQQLHVDVRLNTGVTPALVDEIKPDVLILATGGAAPSPEIPGADAAGTVSALDHKSIKRLLPPAVTSVAIVGGGFIGCQLGVMLAGRGKHVSIIEESGRVCADVGPVHRWLWMKRLRDSGARLEREAKVLEITAEGVRISREGSTDLIQADRVVLARSPEPDTEILERFRGKVPIICTAGECAAPGKLMEAIASGFLTAQAI